MCREEERARVCVCACVHVVWQSGGRGVLTGVALEDAEEEEDDEEGGEEVGA